MEVMALTVLVKTLVSAGQIIYTGAKYSTESLSNIDCASYKSRQLKERCTEIAEDLQQINIDLLITGRGRRLVQTLVNGMKWAHKYDKKCKLLKFINSKSYKQIFVDYHYELSFNFYDLTLSVFITHYFPNRGDNLDGTRLLRLANKKQPPDLDQSEELEINQ